MSMERVRSRQEHVDWVRSHGDQLFRVGLRDSSPDNYRGHFDPDAVEVTSGHSGADGLSRSIVRLVVEPPIDPDDEATFEKYANVPADMVVAIETDELMSVMTLQARSLQPAKVTAHMALDALNHCHDYRWGVGTYEGSPQHPIEA